MSVAVLSLSVIIRYSRSRTLGRSPSWQWMSVLPGLLSASVSVSRSLEADGAGVHLTHHFDHDGDLETARHGEQLAGGEGHARLAREVARGYADRASQIGGDGRDGVVDVGLFGHAATPSVRCDLRYTRRADRGPEERPSAARATHADRSPDT